jgi:hypothetical protein
MKQIVLGASLTWGLAVSGSSAGVWPWHNDPYPIDCPDTPALSPLEASEGKFVLELQQKLNSLPATESLRGHLEEQQKLLYEKTETYYKARFTDYYFHLVCVAIKSDASLSSGQKIEKYNALLPFISSTISNDQTKQSCLTYKFKHLDEAACTSSTADGYFWRKGTRKHGYGINAIPHGAEASCMSDTDLGAVGFSVRYPPYHDLQTYAFFLNPQTERWEMPQGRTNQWNDLCYTDQYNNEYGAFKTKDMKPICGEFEFICSKQK